MINHPFKSGFAVGFILVHLKTSFLLGGVPIVNGILELLSIPGVLLALPMVNALASPFYAIGLISFLNVIAYGIGCLVLARKWRRQVNDPTAKGLKPSKPARSEIPAKIRPKKNL